jgi:hypothetical protein
MADQQRNKRSVVLYEYKGRKISLGGLERHPRRYPVRIGFTSLAPPIHPYERTHQ